MRLGVIRRSLSVSAHLCYVSRMIITTNSPRRRPEEIPQKSDAQLTPPGGWGRDSLTEYLEDYRGNQFATFANKPDEMRDLIRLDGLFLKLMKGAINVRPFFPLNFLLRAHSAYRAAVGAVMAGQLYEAQTLLRLCLEHGAYGFYIGDDSARWERWMRRSDSDASRKAVAKEFHNSKVKEHINKEAKRLGAQFELLYNRLIEFGAHPNELGFSVNTNIRKDGENVHFETVYLQADEKRYDLGLKTSGQVGLWVLHIMQLVYPERYELLGVRVEIEAIRVRY